MSVESTPSSAAPGVESAWDRLPPADTQRWVARRKAEVVRAVEAGLVSVADACARYNISEEEFDSWRARMSRHGVHALKTTQLHYFEKHRRKKKAKA